LGLGAFDALSPKSRSAPFSLWRRKFYTGDSALKAAYELFISFFWIALILSGIFHYAIHGASRPIGGVILVVGAICVIRAKVSIVRKGHLLSFGQGAFSKMTKTMRRTYVIGYLLMAVGYCHAFLEV